MPLREAAVRRERATANMVVNGGDEGERDDEEMEDEGKVEVWRWRLRGSRFQARKYLGART